MELLCVLGPSAANYGHSYCIRRYSYACLYETFFQKSDDPKFWKKNVFFLWKFWQFSKTHNCRFKRSEVFVGMKYIRRHLQTYKTLFKFIYETTMIEVHVAHNFLNKNFRKNCLFYCFEKILCLMYYNHVSVSNVIQNDNMDSYISYFMPAKTLERFNM